MRSSLRVCCVLCMTVLAAIPALANTAESFNFAGLSANEQVLGYYAGGFGSLGSGPGPNYGITFSPNAVMTPGTHGNILTSNGTVVMNVGTEFANSLKLSYATTVPEVVSVWSGYDGSGILLASMTLMPNGWCHNVSRCAWVHSGEGFSGAAASVTFSGINGQFGIGSITLGTRYWGKLRPSANVNGMQTVVTPEPSSIIFLATGLAGLVLVRSFRVRCCAYECLIRRT